MTTLADVLAVHRPQHVLGKLQCSLDCQGRFATTQEWAAHVADAVSAAGLAVIPGVWPGCTVPIQLIRIIRIAAYQYCEGSDDPCDVRELHAARVIAEAITATAEAVRL